MDEREWLVSNDPAAMLHYLENADNWEETSAQRTVQCWHDCLSDRKLRLFACACCRQVWPLLTDPRSRKAVEVAERYADGEATKQEIASTGLGAIGAQVAVGPDNLHRPPADWTPYNRVTATQWALSDEHTAAFRAGQVCNWLSRDLSGPDFAALLRDICGNPFRRIAAYQIYPPGEKLRERRVAIAIANAIYDERRYEDLPILADALEDAGCTNEEILQHCRGLDGRTWAIQPLRGSHVRGCHVLDLLLGRE